MNRKVNFSKEWLSREYLEKKKSATQIGIELNLCHQTILNWLKKYNIIKRSQSESSHLRQVNHCSLSQKAIEWLNGELLGDGYMHGNNWSGRFGYTSKHREYIEYVIRMLNGFGLKTNGTIRKRTNKQHGAVSYSCVSFYYEELKMLYDCWYPDGKKIVPKSLTLTQLTCRQWYIGDGCLEHRKKRSSQIILSTQGFSISDVSFLVKSLRNIGIKATRKPSQNTIRISANPTINFLDYIGKCPVKCYQYKWRIR